MGRIILLYLAAFALPFVSYLMWLRFERWRERLPPEKRPLPWVPLVAIALMLAIMVTLGLAFLGGEPAGGRYIPAHMQDGKLVPGRIEAGPP
ncbi:DUF6111 family protein [Zavarzinia aquatilis]|uniref:Uncharacterized protein n=1 Tax=Zavarzinia aquatilis TaxID=2211142 RepID=A0A317E6T0_9PROT|nr:DUF6111 family protein [Zavarzinia aquatilis]PWR22699.1 hypothetical protein DKG74_12605 [Zavarzinia aquatilis]